MVETDIKHRCFYVEEELLSMPSYPKERQRAKLKRKKSGSADGTSSKKLDSRIDKVATLIMPESLVAMTFCQVVTIDMENLTKILEKTTKEEGLPADEEQPLYIDESNMVVKCRWCKDQFKGSYQLKHLNQHIKKSASHSQQRRRLTERGVEQSDIRDFLLIH